MSTTADQVLDADRGSPAVLGDRGDCSGPAVVAVRRSTLLGNAAYGGHQAYGLLGPVRLRPYGEATITARCTAQAY